jgi:hypothetical protein
VSLNKGDKTKIIDAKKRNDRGGGRGKPFLLKMVVPKGFMSDDRFTSEQINTVMGIGPIELKDIFHSKRGVFVPIQGSVGPGIKRELQPCDVAALYFVQMCRNAGINPRIGFKFFFPAFFIESLSEYFQTWSDRSWFSTDYDSKSYPGTISVQFFRSDPIRVTLIAGGYHGETYLSFDPNIRSRPHENRDAEMEMKFNFGEGLNRILKELRSI